MPNEIDPKPERRDPRPTTDAEKEEMRKRELSKLPECDCIDKNGKRVKPRTMCQRHGIPL